MPKTAKKSKSISNKQDAVRGFMAWEAGMFQQSFSVGGQSDLTLQIEHGGGDLHLLGSDETYVRVQGEGDAADYDTNYQNGTLTLSLLGDCVFFVPRRLNLSVRGRFGNLRAGDLSGALDIDGGLGDVVISGATGSVRLALVMGDLRASELGSLTLSGVVHGDAVVTSVAGAVRLAEVSGDLHVSEAGSLESTGDIAGSAKVVGIREAALLRSVAGDLIVRGAQNLTAGTVHGDLRASDIAADLSVDGVNGDVNIKSVSGNCSITRSGGDAQLSQIGGRLSSFSAGGDLHLQGALGGEGTLEFNAGGDLVLKLPPDTSAQFECTAGGDIINRFSGEKSRSGHGVWKGNIGYGGPLVKCHAGGDIMLKPEEGGDVEIRFEINKEEMRHAQEEVKRAKEQLKRIKHEVRDQLRIHKEEIHRTVHDGLRGFNMGPDFENGPDFETGPRGFRPPRPPRPSRTPRAPRAPHTPGESGFSFDFGPFMRGFRFGQGGKSQPATAKRGPSDEERMTILKMLEEKRITPEQAELLLNALGEK
jgi:hypothetical protein